MVTLPAELLAAVENEIQEAKCNRSEFIRECLEYYMAERKRRAFRRQLAEGYRAMAALNLELAQEDDDDLLGEYERTLSEGE
jgi:metal-responsive CopG/Arc/MetJ family transcriptional regulator